MCPAFAEIGERYGPFDVALIPIGAYGPRWFMSAVHCSPGSYTPLAEFPPIVFGLLRLLDQYKTCTIVSLAL